MDNMDRPEPDLHFRVMAFMYRFRDLFSPRRKIIDEIGLEPGLHVLDYGCGPGGYVAAIAELVGADGRIFAADLHPLALRSVERIAGNRDLRNVETIRTDCNTGLTDRSIDVVLLYDVYHDLADPGAVLKELHRVLKPGGILSFSDHHLKQLEIVAALTRNGLFELAKKGKKTYTFLKKKE